jgi:predicted amidohydrolase YtcJ
MDAEYRERTNAQLKEMVVGYENQIQNWERNSSYYRQDDAASSHMHPASLKNSIRRYEKLLAEADAERVSLLNEITILSKENYQLRV